MNPQKSQRFSGNPVVVCHEMRITNKREEQAPPLQVDLRDVIFCWAKTLFTVDRHHRREPQSSFFASRTPCRTKKATRLECTVILERSDRIPKGDFRTSRMVDYLRRPKRSSRHSPFFVAKRVVKIILIFLSVFYSLKLACA